MKTWGGKDENAKKAQEILIHRARMNYNAVLAKYNPKDETEEFKDESLYEKDYVYWEYLFIYDLFIFLIQILKILIFK